MMRQNLLWGLLVASLAFNAVLGIRLWRHPAPGRTMSASMIGKKAPEVYGHAIGGARAKLAKFARPTIVYVISPSCGWCARNTANITALWQRRSNDHDFIGLSLREDGLSDYLSKNPLPFGVSVHCCPS